MTGRDWTDRYPFERDRVNDHILLQPFEDERVIIGIDPARGSDCGCAVKMRNNKIVSVEFHDNKPDERTDRFVTTEAGDLDAFGRPLKQGR